MTGRVKMVGMIDTRTGKSLSVKRDPTRSAFDQGADFLRESFARWCAAKEPGVTVADVEFYRDGMDLLFFGKNPAAVAAIRRWEDSMTGGGVPS